MYDFSNISIDIEIERGRLETTYLNDTKKRWGYSLNGISIWMEYNEIEPL